MAKQVTRFHCTWCVVGHNPTDIQGRCVDDVIRALVKRYGSEFRDAIFDAKTGRIKPRYVILVNGVPIDSRRDLKKRVTDGDVITIAPMSSGG